MKENSFTIGEYNNYCFGDVRFEIPRKYTGINVIS